jgi:acyl-CoA dehydrogenase
MNEIKTLIEDSINTLFASHADTDAVAIMEAGGFPDRLWRDFFEGGWTRIGLPEDDGGAGMGLAGAYIIMRGAGYHAVPLPIVETLLGTYLLQLAGVTIPEGVTTVAVSDPAFRASVGGSVPPILPRVPWARHAEKIVVVYPGERSASVALVGSSNVALQHANMAGEPRDDVTLGDGVVGELHELPGISAERVLSWLALGRAAQMSGALFRTLEHTVTYANERKQFGQPIGKYQAVQQQIAEQSEYAHAARCAVDSALLHFNTPREWENIAAAKIVAGEAAGKVCRVAHAVHAAIGFTHEYPLQEGTRRLWAWRDEYGNEGRWGAKLGEFCLGLGSGRLWPWLSEQTTA